MRLGFSTLAQLCNSTLHSDVEAIEAYFAPIGEPRPATGKKAAVAVSYGPITTPYMVYFFD